MTPSNDDGNIFFIDKKEIPQNRQLDIMYGYICCNYCEQKKDAYKTRITMGGNLNNYPGDCGTPTVDLLTVKQHHLQTVHKIHVHQHQRFLSIHTNVAIPVFLDEIGTFAKQHHRGVQPMQQS